SLYWSVFNGWIPCRLCWIERLCMYPLVLVCLLGLSLPKTARRLAAPLLSAGTAVSLYHTMLQWRVAAAPLICSPNAPCVAPEFAYFQVVTPAFCALVAFCVMAALLFAPAPMGLTSGRVQRERGTV
ncbi:MAG: disulfide bond formation protein B, partial [Alicyclobacillus sp.]|nr:disulfide bond formation protein B [Alicyclobacillus sp.]